MQKNRFSKVNNSLLELKETELKDREVKKKRTWYDRLINNISEPKRKIVGGFKVFLRQTHLKIVVKKLVWEKKKTKQTKNTRTIWSRYS